MSLAVILLNVSLTLSSVATLAQASPTSAQDGKPDDTTSTRDQGTTQQQNPSASQPTPAATKPAATRPIPIRRKGLQPRHKKPALPPDCNPSATATSVTMDPAASTKAPADPPAAGGATHPVPSPTAPTNCPLPKVIVREGSTPDPSIQLAGGDAGSHAGDVAIQMLASADSNLKKITGTQLSSAQQDMVAQIRQFMDQSKKATEAGNSEQARTLAWKAKTLSEELVSPPQ